MIVLIGLVVVLAAAGVAVFIHARHLSPVRVPPRSSGPTTSAVVPGGTVVCGSVSHCVTFQSDGTTFATLDGGATWSKTVPMTIAPVAMSCPSATTCLAIGDTRPSPESQPTPYTAMAAVTTDGGTTWTNGNPIAPVSERYEWSAVSCASPSDCVAFGSRYLTPASPSPVGAYAKTTDGGASWTIGLLPSDLPIAVSCPTTTQCVGIAIRSTAVDALSTSNSAASWVVPGSLGPASQGQWQATSLTCASAMHCVALSVAMPAEAFVTSDGGTTWSPSPLPLPAASRTAEALVEGLSCPTASVCFVVGRVDAATGPTPVAFQSINGGSTWTRTTPPGFVVRSISCPTATTCVAVGHDGAASTTDGGRTWHVVS